MAVVVELDYTGAVQTFVVPAQVTSIQVELYGAHCFPFSSAHRGGYVKGNLATTPGETLYLYVGGQGLSVFTGGTAAQTAGWNGGGPAGTAQGNGGGGATDVRQGGQALSNRKGVAGGGGGYGGVSSSEGTAGAGGAATGEAGGGFGTATGGGGGTAAAGGAAGTGGSPTAGASGVGGSGGRNGFNSGGGGGGGYFGGGGGGSSATGSGGGGGGSNYVGGLTSTTSTQAVGHPSGASDGMAVLSYNAAPDQPDVTGNTPNADVDVALARVVTWVFADQDSTDTQTFADVRYRIGAGAWTTVSHAATTAGTYSFPANTFSGSVNQAVEWQVRTYDSGGLVSPYSASVYFTPRTAPTAPTLSTAANIPSATPAYSVSTTSNFNQVQVRTVNDVAGSPGSTVIADTGTITLGAAAKLRAGSLPTGTYVNGTNYHMQARVASPKGVWSAWTSTSALIAAINAPLVPTLTINPVLLPTPQAVVQIANPGSDPNPVVSNSIYRSVLNADGSTQSETRVATGLAQNASWTDAQVPLNVTVRYRIQAYSASGAYTSST